MCASGVPAAGAARDECTCEPRVTLRMVLVLFAELLFFALDLNNFLRPPLLIKAQLAHPSTTSSAFPNAGESIRTLNFVV